MPYADPAKNRACIKAWEKKNPEKVRAKFARYYKKTGPGRRYGLTKEQVDWMNVEQGGQCAICFRDISEKPCIDHDHKTGKVRRLLCYFCNTRLEAIEKPGWLEAAQKYLKEHAD